MKHFRLVASLDIASSLDLLPMDRMRALKSAKMDRRVCSLVADFVDMMVASPNLIGLLKHFTIQVRKIM